MLETVMSVLSQIYAVPCGDVGTPACNGSLSIACSPINCAMVLVPAGVIAIAIMAGAASMLRGPMLKLRY